MQGRRALTMFAGAGALALVAGTVQLAAFTPPAQAQGLVAFADCDELLERQRAALAATATEDALWGSALDWFGRGDIMPLGQSLGMPQAAAEDAGAGETASAPTGTNLQEAGVDEPDIAKLADGRIVVVDGGVLRVLSSGGAPQELGSLRISTPPVDDGFDRPAFGFIRQPQTELLLLGDRVLVISASQRRVDAPHSTDSPLAGQSPTPDAQPVEPGGFPDDLIAVTRISLVEVGAAGPRLIEERVQDGRYIAARQVGDYVRVVTSSRPLVPVARSEFGGPQRAERRAENERAARSATVEQILPTASRFSADGSLLETGAAISCTDASYPDADPVVDLLTVTTYVPSLDLEAADVEALTADGENVYVAPDRLYVAAAKVPVAATPMGMSQGNSMSPNSEVEGPANQPREVTTAIHAFDTSAGSETRYIGSGDVPGVMLNRWAMSRHEGVLRAATTTEPAWSGRADESSESMVLTLEERDGRLVETGRLDGLGLTERITAVRYLGDLAAVVTFRQVDPLYLVDLSGPPKLLGELKIPGFSTYLHPLGDGLLLGIGYEADDTGMVTGVQASTFSVSDPANPRQVARVPLTDTSTGVSGDSPALNDSRAFAYDADRRRALIPLTTWGYPSETHSVVAVDVDSGGGLSVADVALESVPSRVLLDGDVFHAVGSQGLLTVGADTLNPESSLGFPN